MNVSTLPLIRLRLAQIASHLVVALIALIVVGGATRVMEAGLACPDWPLCFGSFFPGRQMNLRVFLEWFHRLDALFVGVTVMVQFALAFAWRAQLPKWLPWLYALLVGLILLQGILGAFTVVELLPSAVVTAHLALALTLLTIMSGLTQKLLLTNQGLPPPWWRLMSGSALLIVIFQCILGGWMATNWSADICLSQGQSCEWLYLHRGFSTLVVISVFAFFATALSAGGWPRSQWIFLCFTSSLVAIQIILGFLSLSSLATQPLFTILHQLVASLLVALLAALLFRCPEDKSFESVLRSEKHLLEPCHG